jgi:hypothetical protein
MSEAAVLQGIRLDLGREPLVRLFRNNVGSLLDATGRRVDFGLARGSGDLIGWRIVTVTPEMVGQRVAVFASVEVKTDTGRPTEHQIHWADVVRDAGGFSGIARNPSQARHLLGLEP